MRVVDVTKFSGAHAAFFSAPFPDSHRRSAWLVGAAEEDCSFPHTDGGHLPADRMFLAALTSLSWVSPHPLHIHVLTASMSRPAGPVRAPQLLHACVVYLSLTIRTHLPACWPLYCSCALSMPQPESSTDFAIRVLASFGALTSPTTIV